jgi:hypothetical protein
MLAELHKNEDTDMSIVNYWKTEMQIIGVHDHVLTLAKQVAGLETSYRSPSKLEFFRGRLREEVLGSDSCPLVLLLFLCPSVLLSLL